MFQVLSILAIIVCLTLIVTKVRKQRPHTIFMKIVWSIFVAYLVGNLYCTLYSREFGSTGMLDLRPFKTYAALFKTPDVSVQAVSLFERFMKDALPIDGIILNILLYYPLGYLLPILYSKLKPKHVILIGCLCSIATEATQYLLKMGWCETDDVIHNTLGTAIGVWVWLWQSKRLNLHRSANPGKGET